MRVIVHREKCQGHARCWALAPELFDLDDEGFIVPGDLEVPAGAEKKARHGALSCPERALEIED